MGRFNNKPRDLENSNPGVTVEVEDRKPEKKGWVEKEKDKAVLHANERASRSGDDKEKVLYLPPKQLTESDKIVMEDTKPENVTSRVQESQAQMDPVSVPNNNNNNNNNNTTSNTILDDPEVQKTDEGILAKEVIESGDITKIENLATPEGEPIVKPIYDGTGRVTDFEKLVPESAELYSQKTAIALTLLSAILYSLSGGMFPPFNFIDMRWDEAKNKDAGMRNELHRLYNEGASPTIATETRLQSAYNNPDLYGRNNTDAAARGSASANGNVSLEQTQMNADLQKSLQENQLNMNLQMLKLNNAQQIAMAQLLYDQDVKRDLNELTALKNSGTSVDEIAKLARSKNGITKLAAGIGYGKDIATGITSIINSIIPDTSSDKNVKTFDKKINNDFLRKAFKRR